jgi:hypothetical protein
MRIMKTFREWRDCLVRSTTHARTAGRAGHASSRRVQRGDAARFSYAA